MGLWEFLYWKLLKCSLLHFHFVKKKTIIIIRPSWLKCFIHCLIIMFCSWPIRVFPQVEFYVICLKELKLSFGTVFGQVSKHTQHQWPERKSRWFKNLNCHQERKRYASLIPLPAPPPIKKKGKANGEGSSKSVGPSLQDLGWSGPDRTCSHKGAPNPCESSYNSKGGKEGLLRGSAPWGGCWGLGSNLFLNKEDNSKGWWRWSMMMKPPELHLPDQSPKQHPSSVFQPFHSTDGRASGVRPCLCSEQGW